MVCGRGEEPQQKHNTRERRKPRHHPPPPCMRAPLQSASVPLNPHLRRCSAATSLLAPRLKGARVLRAANHSTAAATSSALNWRHRSERQLRAGGEGVGCGRAGWQHGERYAGEGE